MFDQLPPYAVSFTDDTSLPHVGWTVSIHAQVVREHRIDWYFFMKNRAPHGRGEFKNAVVNTFFSLTECERERAFRTLRSVRIHIVDPRAYMPVLLQALGKVLPEGTSPMRFLRRLDESTHRLRMFRESIVGRIANRMLRDSPAERLKDKYRSSERMFCESLVVSHESLPGGMISPKVAYQCGDFDLTPFQGRKAHLLNEIAKFTAASASVFSPAIDELEQAANDDMFSLPGAGSWLLRSALGRPHAFDAGHSNVVRWIEQRRDETLAQVGDDCGSCVAYPLQELISSESVPIQAADIAASLARELWHRNSLTHLVRRFEYVTYNGERLSEARAEFFDSILHT